ncbi:hypothetical protein FHS21_005826 [Phyllobacterium trifolii]|uniref:Uncharacterized protein n=1 Tax=Phyllobacterium trifolii TaxID=300193 RepID=A0A839UHW0_9HYPH|nr:hypothetical protein [Phyllobacterium trifolii]
MPRRSASISLMLLRRYIRFMSADDVGHAYLAKDVPTGQCVNSPTDDIEDSTDFRQCTECKLHVNTTDRYAALLAHKTRRSKD